MYSNFDKSRDAAIDTKMKPKKDNSVWFTKVQPISTLDLIEKNEDDDDEAPRKIKTIKRDVKNFGGDVTLHGLRYVTDSDNHILRRLIWLGFLVGIWFWLGHDIRDSFSKFWDYPLSTVITMNYVKNISFPAVTICNYNNFKASIVTPEQAMIASSIFNPNPNDRLPVNWTAYVIQTGRPLDTEAFVLNTAHRKEDMVYGCTWRSVEHCDSSNFTKMITDWGVCYSFNNNPHTALEVKLPGSSNGLKLNLNVEQYEYTYGENTGAGMKVLLHAPGQFPLVKELGFSVAPGFQTSVSVRFNSVTNLGSPYPANCTSRPLAHSKHYTVALCRYECKVDYVISVCGCKDLRYQDNGEDIRICDPPEQIDCVYPAENDFIAKNIECDCNVPCHSSGYEGRVSMASWPSEFVARDIERTLNVSKDFAKKNLIELAIYFEELSYQEIKQVPAYDVGSLQSDVGGYMGLLCGMSIITVGEFIDFTIKMFFRHCRRKKKIPSKADLLK